MKKINDDNFIKWIYRICTNKKQARDDDLEYRGLLEAVKRVYKERLKQLELSQQEPSTPLQQTPPPRRRVIDPDLVPLSEYEAVSEQSPRVPKSQQTKSPIIDLTRSSENLPQEILSTRIFSPTTGKGFSTGSGFNICPDNIINDVSRLEVLIGEKRAGNNSREIINEAVGICQRLLNGKIIDSHIYGELIDELIDSD